MIGRCSPTSAAGRAERRSTTTSTPSVACGRSAGTSCPKEVRSPATVVAIEGVRFLINGRVTYPGRTWNGRPIEGLLFNSRMVQATFDDRNPATVGRWSYPDTNEWDAERNVTEFIAEMPGWRQ